MTALIKLDSNENPFGPSPSAVKAMQVVLASCNAYPDNEASALRLKLADHHGVRVEQILITAGLTEFLGMIAQTFLVNGLHAVTSERSFIVYRIAAEAANAQLIEVSMRDDGFDLAGIAAAITRNTRIIFLANPNNPTGTIVTPDEVDHFLGHIPEDVMVVLDEAYYEFAVHFAAKRALQYSRSLDYVRDGRNVVVLRTFSKVHGLAGLRVGYGIAPAELIERISRQRALFCVSTLAQAGALAALDDEAHIRKTVENNTDQSERLMQGISELGCTPIQTWANFLYCHLGQDAGSFAQCMELEGIAVRPLRQWGDPEAIRVTIGTPQQNDVLLKTLRKLKFS